MNISTHVAVIAITAPSALRRRIHLSHMILLLNWGADTWGRPPKMGSARTGSLADCRAPGLEPNITSQTILQLFRHTERPPFARTVNCEYGARAKLHELTLEAEVCTLGLPPVGPLECRTTRTENQGWLRE